jgi:hypothetical protein
VTSKRLALLHELVPKAARMAVLVNPANAPTTEVTLRDAKEGARALGLLGADVRRVSLKTGVGRVVIPDGVANIVRIAFRPISPARALGGGRAHCHESQRAHDEQ